MPHLIPVAKLKSGIDFDVLSNDKNSGYGCQPAQPRAEEAGGMTTAERQFFLEMMRFEIQIVESRSNLFLLSESFLLAAISQVFPYNTYRAIGFRTAVLVLAITITAIWLIVGLRKSRNIEILHSVLESDPDYSRIYRLAPPRLRNTTLIGIWLPILVQLAWAAIAIFLFFSSNDSAK